MSTLYKKDPNNLARVLPELNKENQWVFNGYTLPTRKFDGTAAAIIRGILYKRYDVKKGKNAPANALPCQEPDMITGHWPHWMKCERDNPADQWHFSAFDQLENIEDGTFELCGEKIKGNPEKMKGHHLIKHGSVVLPVDDFSYEGLKQFFSTDLDIEGIVFHHTMDGRMCKIRKSDFGIKRIVEVTPEKYEY